MWSTRILCIKRLNLRWLLPRLAAVLGLFVLAGVTIAFQFPSFFAGRKSSVELLEELFAAPAELTESAAKAALKAINREAVVLFIRSFDLPDAPQARLVSEVRSERTREVTLPFVYYLYELYSAGSSSRDLDYGPQEAAAQAGDQGGPDIPTLLRESPRWRMHVRNTLLLYDALFLQVKPGADGKPVHWRYDEAAYQDVKRILRAVGRDLAGTPDDAMNAAQRGRNESLKALDELLSDDERLTDFAEFFADFVRDSADRWLRSFVRRDQRRRRRLEWVEDRIARRRYFEIADYARARGDRKLVLHVVVDGVQGKLLEGLVQLSSGQRDGSGARYVADLVSRHRKAVMNPSSYPSTEQVRLPPLGAAIGELADTAPDRPEYLDNLKRYFLGPRAQAVRVNVATVDTPTISVRNLPIVYSGHRVGGPHGTGIPNFSYLDRRTERGWYFWGSDILHFRRIFANREAEIPGGARREGPGARTLFERLWRYNTLSAMATVDNGALEIISAEVGVAAGELERNFIEKVIVENFRRRAAMENQLDNRRRWLVAHRHINHGFLAELLYNAVDLKTFRDNARFLARHEDQGLPDYALWYNPWPDHFAHGKGPFSDEILGYAGEYDRFDFYLGKMLAVYRSVRSADGKSSCLDRTLVGLVSDHGFVYTPRLVSTESLLFDAMRDEGLQIKTQKLTVDEGDLPAIHGRERFKPTRPFDAVVGSTAGGSYVIDLFHKSGLEGDDEAWRRHPDYHQVRVTRLLSGQTIDWIDHLVRHLADSMDIAVVREHGPDAEHSWPKEVISAVRIVSPGRGEARILRLRADRRQPVRYRYEILGQGDPLDLVGSVRPELIPAGGPSVGEVGNELRRLLNSTAGATDRQWQTWLSYTLRADSIHQLSHLYDTPRAGTINVFPLEHVGINSSVPGRHAGETFAEKNGAQLYFGADLRRATIQTARNGSLPVTLYHWFVGDDVFNAPESEKGPSPRRQFGFESLLDEIRQPSPDARKDKRRVDRQNRRH